MQPSSMTADKNIEEFRKRRTRQWLVVAPVVLLVLGLMWFRDHPQASVMGVTANAFAIGFLTVLVAATAFSFMNWRCPACNGYLGRAMNPKFCGKCGTQLL